MQKAKRILALLGVILLIGLYLSTLVCALSSNENFSSLLAASIYATVIVPVLIWTYSFIYRLLKDHFRGHDPDDDTSGTD